MIVSGEIADGDVLTVPGVVPKTERFVVQHFDEPLRAAAVLDIGRAGGGHFTEKRGIEFGNESRKLRCHAIGKARGNALLVAARGAALGLCAACRAREDYVAVVRHGGSHSNWVAGNNAKNNNSPLLKLIHVDDADGLDARPRRFCIRHGLRSIHIVSRYRNAFTPWPMASLASS